MPKIYVVVPCYNEASRLPVDSFLKFGRMYPNVMFCFVNDGSTDSTINVLHQLQEQIPGSVLVLDNKVNQGKAETVRVGMTHIIQNTAAEYLSFLDADLATPIDEILRLYEEQAKYQSAEMVLASRIKRLGANIDRSGIRHIMGRVMATFVSILFKIPIYDSQCGAKVIKRELAAEIFKEPFISKWLFDIELVIRARQFRNNQITHLLEVPLNEWVEKGDSRIKLKDVLVFPYHLLKIRLHYKK
jgi:glycosyltransferase involved in cell wall biosynthesis